SELSDTTSRCPPLGSFSACFAESSSLLGNILSDKHNETTRRSTTSDASGPKQLTDDLELIPRASKAAAPVALIIGAIYLFFYCVAYRSPVPVDLSSLPMLLMAIFMVCVVLFALLLLFFAAPAIALTTRVDGRYWPIDLTGSDQVDWEADRKRVAARRSLAASFVTMGIPAAMMCYGLLALMFATGYGYWFSGLLAFTAGTLVAVWGFRKYGTRPVRSGAFIATAFGILFHTCLLVIATGATLLVSRELLGNPSDATAAVLLLLIPLGLAFVTSSITSMSIEVRERSRYRKLQFVTLVLGFGLIGMTPIGTAVCKVALGMLGAGGGQENVLVLDRDLPNFLCETICDPADHSRSTQLKVLLRTNHRVVVETKGDTGVNEVTIVEVPAEFVKGVLRTVKKKSQRAPTPTSQL
ncbi:MAG: hypothetical protein KDB22_26420, partial [Planctomycetales bacterium]|nr:hypothetical protein [Planctomycetales bacterium]